MTRRIIQILFFFSLAGCFAADICPIIPEPQKAFFDRLSSHEQLYAKAGLYFYDVSTPGAHA